MKWSRFTLFLLGMALGILDVERSMRALKPPPTHNALQALLSPPRLTIPPPPPPPKPIDAYGAMP